MVNAFSRAPLVTAVPLEIYVPHCQDAGAVFKARLADYLTVHERPCVEAQP